jgi:solute carrier family 35 protein C2
MIAFCMTASEFALLQRTSVVTLSIAGIFKEVVTISAAGIVFGDDLTPINVSGLLVTIGAIAAYNWIKIRKMREDARKAAHDIRQDADCAESGSDADGESEEEDDWGMRDDNYVTNDGDIMPSPSRFEPRSASGPSPSANGSLHPNRAQMEALASSKKDLSD